MNVIKKRHLRYYGRATQVTLITYKIIEMEVIKLHVLLN